MPRRMLALGLASALAAAAVTWLATSALGEGTHVPPTLLGAHLPGLGVPGPVAELRALTGGLSLTQRQRDRIDQIAAVHQESVRPAQIRAGRKGRELRDLIGSGEADESEVRAKVAQLSDAMAEAAVLTSRASAAIISVLTPAQRERLSERREQRRKAAERWTPSSLPGRGHEGCRNRRGHHAQDAALPPDLARRPSDGASPGAAPGAWPTDPHEGRGIAGK